jgi:hypothetical protein
MLPVVEWTSVKLTGAVATAAKESTAAAAVLLPPPVVAVWNCG